jgi:hypothetical protein
MLAVETRWQGRVELGLLLSSHPCEQLVMLAVQ